MGLIELEWVETQNNIDRGDYTYIDYVEKAEELIALFKAENCDLIVAVTHMRTYNEE